jgi:hypothetical protein
MAVKAKKNQAAVVLGRKGGKKGGPARAASLTPEQRSESARKAVQARWAKTRKGSGNTVKGKVAMNEPITTTPPIQSSKKALHLCLKHIKNARNESELRRLTEELQRIVFHRQYENAEN